MGNGVLQFTFANILLPDSLANEPASHGFVKFRIAQKPHVPLGSVIKNSAAIFFDFNPPVLTNETWHTVGENFMLAQVDESPSQAALVQVFPNPCEQSAIFEWKKMEVQSGVFRLFDVTGRLVRAENFSGRQFRFERRELAGGIYFFRFETGGEVMASGKLVAK